MSGVIEAQEVDIGPVSQIPLGEGRNFELDGMRVAVFRTHAGEVFAAQPRCPHRAGPLADGLIGGASVMCPLHDRVYDLRTGTCLSGDVGLVVYAVRVTATGNMYFRPGALPLA